MLEGILLTHILYNNSKIMELSEMPEARRVNNFTSDKVSLYCSMAVLSWLFGFVVLISVIMINSLHGLFVFSLEDF